MEKFNFGNIIKVFRGEGLSSTFSEYLNSAESDKNLLELNISNNCPEWIRIHIYLNDNRVVKNVFVHKGKYLFGIRRWTIKGQVARDAIEDVVFFPEIYKDFNFQKSNIRCIQIDNKQSCNQFIFLRSKRPLIKEILTATRYWDKLPNNSIIQINSPDSPSMH